LHAGPGCSLYTGQDIFRDVDIPPAANYQLTIDQQPTRPVWLLVLIATG
jgi:hypothetical protein